MSDVEAKPLNALVGTGDYQELANAFVFAFQQAAGDAGKGKERHGTTQTGAHVPYTDQAIVALGKMFRNGPVPSGLLYQVAKKAQEAQRMTPEAAVHELRGVIVYAATAMMLINNELDTPLF